MAVEVNVVVDRSVNGGELLQGLDVPEFRHCPFPSPESLVWFFGPIVEPASAVLTVDGTDPFDRRTIRSKAVRYDRLRTTGAFHRAPQKLQRGLAIPAFRSKDLAHLAFVVDGAPKVMCFPVDPDEDLIQVPAPL